MAESLVSKRKETALKKASELSSLLAQDATRINELLETGEQDDATTLIYKRLTQSCVDAIPLVENVIRESGGGRGVYQFNQMVTTLRELLADLQAIKARGQIGVRIVDSVIRPFMLDLGMMIVKELKVIEEDARSTMSPDDYIRFRDTVTRSRNNIAGFVNTEYSDMKRKVQEMLEH